MAFDKLDILEDVKQELSYMVNRLNLDNLGGSRDSITSYLDFLEKLNSLPDPVSHEDTLINDSVETNQVEEKQANITPSQDSKGNSYTFVRKLRGGYVPELDAMVPEKIVRQMYLRDGDRLNLESMTTGEEGRKYCTWSIAQRSQGAVVPEQAMENRIQFDLCIVERQAGHLVVQSQWRDMRQAPLRHDDLPLSFVLRDEEVQEFSLQEGDLIDIATVSDKLDYFCKVIWRYETESSVMNSTPTRYSKKKTTSISPERSYESVENIELLRDRRILVVGGDKEKTYYRDAFENCGSAFDWASGDEGQTRLAAMVRKVDAIVLVRLGIGHHASWTVGSLAKDEGVPFREAVGFGVTTVIRKAIEALMLTTTEAV